MKKSSLFSVAKKFVAFLEPKQPSRNTGSKITLDIEYQADFPATPGELIAVPCLVLKNQRMSWAYRQIIAPSFDHQKWVGIAFSNIVIWNPSLGQKLQVLLGHLDPNRFPGVPCDKQKQAPLEGRSRNPNRIFEFAGFGTFELEGIQLLIDDGLVTLYRGQKHDFLLPTPKLVKLCKQSASFGFIY